MISYWEQESFTRYDYVVVGAGIVGLSTAVELKERFSTARVLVLERGLLPTGASTRNAGFACMGSVTELLDDLTTQSEEEVVRLFELRKKGLERLRARLGDRAIGYAAEGSYELISRGEEEALGQIDYLNKLLSPITGRPAFLPADEKIAEFGFAPSGVKALIQNTCEGSLHTGKLLRALVDYTIQKGVEIKTGAAVQRFWEQENEVGIELADPCRQQHLNIFAKAIVLCTNAFTKELLPDVDVVPGRGQVLITQPVAGLKFKGIFHFEKGYYYFREVDGRVLLGGGRNLDVAGETATSFDLNERIQMELERKLQELILPHTHFQIAQRWSGIMAFGASKNPIVKQFSPRVFGAFRMGGMGVALGSEVALQVASMVADANPT